MEKSSNNYRAYSLRELLHLAKEAVRLNDGGGLVLYLREQKFHQHGANLFFQDEPLQLILLTPDNKNRSYVNLFDVSDQGHLIQFIQNRILEEGKIIPNEKMYTFFSAVEVALQMETRVQNQMEKVAKTVNHQPQKNRKKGKRKGL